MQIRAAGHECGQAVVKALGNSSDRAARLIALLLVVVDIESQRPHPMGKSASMPSLAKPNGSADTGPLGEPTKEVRVSLVLMCRSADSGKCGTIRIRLTGVESPG